MKALVSMEESLIVLLHNTLIQKELVAIDADYCSNRRKSRRGNENRHDGGRAGFSLQLLLRERFYFRGIEDLWHE